MKKILTALTGIILLLGIPSTIKAEQGKGRKPKDHPQGMMMERQGRPIPQEGLKKAIGIRRRMRQIEMEAIKNDPELQDLQQQIVELHKQMKAKLNEKLADDEEYQKLKEQLEKMKQEWKNKWEKRRKEKSKGKEKAQGKGKRKGPAEK